MHAKNQNEPAPRADWDVTFARSFLERDDLSASAKMVFLTLSCYANETTRIASPSRATIARVSGTKEKLTAYLKELTDAGLIRRTGRRKGRNGSLGPVEYWVKRVRRMDVDDPVSGSSGKRIIGQTDHPLSGSGKNTQVERLHSEKEFTSFVSVPDGTNVNFEELCSSIKAEGFSQKHALIASQKALPMIERGAVASPVAFAVGLAGRVRRDDPDEDPPF